VLKYDAMKTYGGVEEDLQVFLTYVVSLTLQSVYPPDRRLDGP
jgi:hypothetical protein